jgi:hypothetical protein
MLSSTRSSISSPRSVNVASRNTTVFPKSGIYISACFADASLQPQLHRLQVAPESRMSHVLSLFFAFVLSFGHLQPAEAHNSADFIQTETGIVSTYGEIAVGAHTFSARRIALNSYSEDACLSCRSTNSTSQPHLIWRAQR